MRKFIIIAMLGLLFANKVIAQFSYTTSLTSLSISANTREKPQSKVWIYDNKNWCVLSSSSGAYVCRLDGTTWTKVLKLSSDTNFRADCKVVGNVVHIFLFWENDSELASIEYVPTGSTYKKWTTRTSNVGVSTDANAETATIDIDSNGRMWVAYDTDNSIKVRWSDSPYSNWSSAITVASNINADDIGTVIAFPMFNKIGVFWSNQNTQRWGFRMHTDGASPSTWSADENPASQSAKSVGLGFADDHMNLKVGSNGTLYCAVKTSYDTPGYTKITLLVRRPNGSWDNAYKVSEIGTRGIVVLNEQVGKIRVVYASNENDGDILYRESALSSISFGSEQTLISGTYNNPTCIKNSYTEQVVILASSSNDAVGVIATDIGYPALDLPLDKATGVSLSPTLSWNAVSLATSYQVQVSKSSGFSSLIMNTSNITALSTPATGLTFNTLYYWRVRAMNASGTGSWSAVRSFTTVPTPLPVTPVLASPANLATGLGIPPTLSWNAGDYAQSYQVQVSAASDFLTTQANISNITTLSSAISGLNWSTQYFWRVRSVNTSGSSDWSEVRSFTTQPIPVPGAPGLASPSNGATGVAYSPTLSWNAATYASTYQMQLATTSDFLSPVSDVSNISALNTRINSLNYSTQYFWRVRATNSSGTGPWSTVRSFTSVAPPPIPGTPSLSSPSNGATGMAISRNFSWNSSSNAYTYQLQMSTVSDFATLFKDTTDLTVRTITISKMAYSTKYYWRVRAVNTTGTGNWSSVRSFTTVGPPISPAPVLAFPLGAASGVTLPAALSWNATLNAATYQVQVSLESDFGTKVYNVNTITTLNTSVPGLAYSTLYYWRVRAINVTGTGSWSAVRTFTTEAISLPGAPTLATPADIATNISIPAALSWNAGTYAQSYQVQVATASTFQTPVADISNINGLDKQVSGLAYNSLYYWRVRTNNSSGSSAWSDIRSFTTGAQPANLVGHWQMEEPNGTTLTDASTFGNNASTTGSPTKVTGVFGQALQLNGTSQYATVPSSASLSPANAITLAAWIKPEQTGSAQVILKKGVTGTADGYELSLTSTAKIMFRYNQVSGGDTYRLLANTLHPTNGNTWMHIAATFDGSTIKIYVNGALDKSVTLSSPPAINSNTLPLAIGAQSTGGNRFKGAIDDPRVYNVALNAADISSLATLPAARMAAISQPEAKEIPTIEFQASPNPFTTATTVYFTMPASGDYAITLYNIAGHPVKVLKKGYANAGEKLSVEVKGEELQTGLFMVRLQTSKHSQALKLMHDFQR